MIKSMTGFGLSRSIGKESEVYVEIKGVNHKFLDISTICSLIGIMWTLHYTHPHTHTHSHTQLSCHN